MEAIDFMKLIEQVDPVHKGVFLAKSLTEVYVDANTMIFRGNVGPGVDAFFVHCRDGDVSKLWLILRGTGEVFEKAKKAIDNED